MAKILGGSQVKRFDIIFDSPSGAFYSGQIVSGKVVIDLTESMKVRCVKLRWVGEASVNFQDTNTKKKVSECQKYFDETVVLFGSGDSSILGETTVLNSGHMEYPFSFTPPRNLPSSFESSLGHVRYLCRATIHRPWVFNVNTKKAFTLVSAVDLNGEPKAFTPGYAYSDKRFSFADRILACVRGGLAVTVKLDRCAYVPGERILVNAEVSNYSSKKVKGVEAFIQQNVIYTTSGGASCYCSGNTKIGLISQGAVPCGEVQVWHQELLHVPALPPSKLGGCKLINIDYLFKVIVDVENSPSIVLIIPIIIGTIPLHQRPLNWLPADQQQQQAPVRPPAPVPRLTTQPSAPPEADLLDLPPLPSYEECTHMDQGNIEDGEDNEQQFGDRTYRPLYPTYAQLHRPPPAVPVAMEAACASAPPYKG